MAHIPDKKLKAAIEEMNQVVASLQYHTKLKRAWGKLRPVIEQAVAPAGPKQKELFK